MNTKLKYVFGPIPSRRLGMSLGVDLVPHKICNYDCVFCEVGITKRTVTVRKEYVKKETIINELKVFFDNFVGKIDHITLTGAGETTLNSKLSEIIAEIKSTFKYPIAVLTHSGNIYEEEVRKGLSFADVVCPSLDAASQEIFEKINRPDKTIKIQNVIEGLIKFREEFKGKILLEILLVKGINDTEDELQKIGKTCSLIRPDMVQINTVDRPGAYSSAIPLSSEELQKAKQIISSFYPKVEVLSRHYSNPEPIKKSEEEISEDILSILKRRPLTVLDIVISEGIEFFKAKEIVNKLLNQNKIEEVILNGNRFYKLPTRTFTN
ncbi:MAG: radical SAM protein [Brevinematales bacterium]|nr:radical SAM protein [Brevinematales bacterium]